MKFNKEREVLKSLRKKERTAGEISNYIQANYYTTIDLIKTLLEQGKIEMITFRNKKYYKLKEVKK